MSTLRCRLFPVVGRQRHSPNVSWLIKFDPAVQRVLRIDIDNPSRSTLIRQVDANRDSHSTAQSDCGYDQRSMKVDDDGLAIARSTPSFTLNRDQHLERDTSTSSGLAKCRWGGHEGKDTCGIESMKASTFKAQLDRRTDGLFS